MPIDGVNDYYLNRRRESLAMSRAATDPSVRKIHLELARLYAERASNPTDGENSRPVLSLFGPNEA